jgi:hypothetical protein
MRRERRPEEYEPIDEVASLEQGDTGEVRIYGKQRRVHLPRKRTLGVMAAALLVVGGAKVTSSVFWDQMQRSDQKAEATGIDQQRILGGKCLKGTVVLGSHTVILKTPHQFDPLHVPVIGHLPFAFGGNVKRVVAKGEELPVTYPRLHNVDGRTVLEFTFKSPTDNPPPKDKYASPEAVAAATYQVNASGITMGPGHTLDVSTSANLSIFPSNPHASEVTTMGCRIGYNGVTKAAGELAAVVTVNPGGDLPDAGTFQAWTGRQPFKAN